MSSDVLSLALGCSSLGLLSAWLVAQFSVPEAPSLLTPYIDPLRTLH